MGSFSADFQFRAERKKVTSRAELKILQLELWLKPARLKLITIIVTLYKCNLSFLVPICHTLTTMLINCGLVKRLLDHAFCAKLSKFSK